MKQITVITSLFMCLCFACTQQSQNQKISQTNTLKPIENELAAPTTPQIAIQETITLETNTIAKEKTPQQKETPRTKYPQPKTITTAQTITETPKKQETSISTKIPETIETFKNIADLYKKLEKAPQTFSLPTNTTQKITCKQGTILTIPENAFINEKTGEPIKGKVDLKIKEYYKTADFLTANLTTQTKDAILETGGTIHIEAVANGQKCALQKEIEIAFPYETPKEGMQLFEGKRDEQGQMIWETMATEGTEVVEAIKTEDISNDWNEETFGLNSPAPTLALPDSLGILRKIEKVKKPKFPGGKRALNKYIQDAVQYPYAALKNKKIGTVIVEFYIEPNGSTSNIQIRKSAGQSLDKAAHYIISQMPTWKNKNTFIHPKAISIKFTLNHNQYRPSPEAIKEAKAFEEKIKDINLTYVQRTKINKNMVSNALNDTTQAASTSLISQYILSSSKLGWINCDRFYKDRSPKINYFVNIEQNQNIDIKIIFHKIDAILNGRKQDNKYVFYNIPINHPITILAIKQVDGKNYVARQETKVQKNDTPTLNFQAVTLDQLQEEITQINAL